MHYPLFFSTAALAALLCAGCESVPQREPLPLPPGSPAPQPFHPYESEPRPYTTTTETSVTTESSPSLTPTPTPTPPSTPQLPPPTSSSTPSTGAPSASDTATAPFGVPVPGKPGYVTSPFSQDAGYIDVSGMAPGSLAKDPYTGKVFRVP